MKKNVTISIALAAVLFGATAVMANSLIDTVAKKEAKALVKGKVKGESAAKAKVESTVNADQVVAEVDTEKFAKEAKADEKKVDESTKVKEIEKKDQQAAKSKIKAFKEEVESDIKKKLK